MQSFIPDSVSPEELKALLTPEVPEIEPADLHSQLWQVANKHLTAMYEELSDPLVHKVAAMIILRRFVDFHENVAEDKFGDQKQDALAWAADAGRLDLAWALLKETSIGNDDPYCE